MKEKTNKEMYAMDQHLAIQLRSMYGQYRIETRKSNVMPIDPLEDFMKWLERTYFLQQDEDSI